MELVEAERRHALQRGVVLHHPGENAFGNHLHPRARTHAMLEAHSVADGGSDLFAKQAGHLLRGGPRGESPRFEHEDPAVAAPRRVKQRQRYAGGLSRARRGHQHRARCRRECGEHLRQHVVDWQWRSSVESGHAGNLEWRCGVHLSGVAA